MRNIVLGVDHSVLEIAGDVFSALSSAMDEDEGYVPSFYDFIDLECEDTSDVFLTDAVDVVFFPELFDEREDVPVSHLFCSESMDEILRSLECTDADAGKVVRKSHVLRLLNSDFWLVSCKLSCCFFSETSDTPVVSSDELCQSSTRKRSLSVSSGSIPSSKKQKTE